MTRQLLWKMFVNFRRAIFTVPLPAYNLSFIFFQPVRLSTRNPDPSPSHSHKSIALDAAVVVFMLTTETQTHDPDDTKVPDYKILPAAFDFSFESYRQLSTFLSNQEMKIEKRFSKLF